MKKKIGLIGVGNMGTAILDGVLEQKLLSPQQCFVFDKFEDKAKSYARKRKVKRATSLQDLAGKTDILLLAIKPQDLPALAEEIKPSLRARHAGMSILAGVTLKNLKKHFGRMPWVRVMPNLGAQVGESMTALTGPKGSTLNLSNKIFSACGKTVVLKENFFDLVTAMSGSGPAYFFLLMELITEHGQKSGLKPEEAKLLAVQTALGASLLAAGSEFSPGELRSQVTSKGGTTAAALSVFQDQKIRQTVQKALRAAEKRGAQLSALIS